jgi:3-isopropylmalate/(R)-2-methylmalate dehydratase large subunit
MSTVTSKTLYQKLVDSHTVRVIDEQNVLLFCDLHLMNEYTSPQAFTGLHDRKSEVLMPGQNVAVVSHIIPTHSVPVRVIHDAASALQATNLAKNCTRHSIPLFDTNDAMQVLSTSLRPSTA